MKKLFLNTCAAWFCGWGFGIWLGFYDYNGTIFYDLRSGIIAGALFGGAFACACWVDGCRKL